VLTERLLDSLDEAIVLVEEPSGQQQQFIMARGFLKNVLGGVISGIADGGIGGGNILNHVAQSITGGGGGGGLLGGSGGGFSSSDRAVPGELDFSNALGVPLPEDNDLEMAIVTPAAYPPRPDINPRPSQRPRPNPPGEAPVFPDAVPMGQPNPNLNYASPIGPTMPGYGPVKPTGMYGQGGMYTGTGGSSGGCSCRPKRSCEEKCVYNAQMKEQCKPCRSWFRSQKKYIYPPKRRRTYRRKRTTYRRKYRRQ